MQKRFNTTGLCVPKKHYMVNIDNKLRLIENMVSRGDYFTINRPRQFGKTTTLNLLEKKLEDKFTVISISFEGIGDAVFKEEESFSNKFLELMERSLEFGEESEAIRLKELSVNINNLDDVSKIITKFVKASEKEVILVIDEVDKSSNNQLFLSFLGILRNKYLLRDKDKDYTFLSVILSGVYDVKNLKLKLREDEEKKLNSPWNIAVNFDVNMSFSSTEIETMLVEYCVCNNIKMNTLELAEKIYYYTSGYPFLVSLICQVIDEKIIGDDKRIWNTEDIASAVKQILKGTTTLFDDIIKNIESNKDIYNLIERIILIGDEIPFTASNLIIPRCFMYGIIKEENNKCKIYNRIFELFLYNHMAAKVLIETTSLNRYNFRENFVNEDGSLNIQLMLTKFQQFMKEQYSSTDADFIEREGRLLFLAFIKPIINGVGFDFKEVQISEEKRLDVVITYNNFKYIIELKIWNGQKYHEKGIEQLQNYLNTFGVDKGYLIIYNFNKSKEYKQETINFKGKELFVVYV